MPEQEALLLELYARTRDAGAFRSLVETHQHMVFAACYRVLQNRTDADDAAQECFFRLAQAAGRLSAPIAGWLHTVAVQRAIDLLRRRIARHRHESRAARLPRHAASSWEDIREEVDVQIARLPERLRVPVVLCYLEGRTQGDVARQLGISQPAVSGRLKRAIALLRRQFARRGTELPAGVLVPWLTANATEAAPRSLSAALGKMALAGVGASAAGAGVGKALALAAAWVGLLLGVAGMLVWTLRAGPNERRARPVAAVAPADSSISAPTPGAGVVECTLGTQADGSDMFIDLDTGQGHAMPAGVADPQAMVKWMRSAGADAFFSRLIDAERVLGADLAAVRVASSAWDSADMGGELRVPAAAAPEFPVRLEVGRGSPTTYLVHTREGRTVLLELTHASGGGVRLRYRQVPAAS
ncbi:MAG: sigma-70 family RNA polymerase sigma factor [Candidatus Brocadiaceae bacterium]|nr:sigma-70 family RNA polymerase sigma factor [Candidatus Brocadiaceae bacterium]